MSEPFLGEVRLFAGTYAPRNWAICDGRFLAISQYPALYSIIGTTYGGDGRTTFALPDLRGRVAVGEGAGPGLTNRTLGQRSGTENHTLTVSQLPSHDHASGPATINVVTGAGNEPNPNGHYLASQAPPNLMYHSGPATETMAADAVDATTAPTGGDASFDKMPPFLCVNYIIAIRGVFPPRG